MTWHADPAVLAAYHRAEVDETVTASIEAHLLRCAECRHRYATHSLADSPESGPWLDAIWDEVIDRVDEPRRSLVERVLGRLGVAAHTARLLAATPTLQLSWLLSIAGAVLTAVALTRGSDTGPLLQLLVAPLLPPLAVALAYGAGVDPAYELGVATPTHGLRLVLLRTIASVAVTIAVGLVTTLMVPWSWTALAWLLPSLGLAALTLAMRTFNRSPLRCALAVDAGWALVVVLSQDRHRAGVEGMGPGTQVAFVVLGAAALVVVSLRAPAVAEVGR